jgi:hypothetical protein
MCQQLEQLKVIDSVPEDFEQRDILVNRALDIRSACMQYLSANIRHNATFFGTMGIIHSNRSLTYQVKSSKYLPEEIASWSTPQLI